jgi:AcrR family transcriptional regulator
MVDSVYMTATAARPEALDERLVGVTLTLLADEGLESISLRRIARRAGVSHGAPLRHFPGLADLLAEVAARGFALLTRTIESSAAELPAGAGARARLAAAGRGYARIAVEHPDLFALMFRPDQLNVARPAYGRESQRAFESLARLVRAAQDEGWQPARDTRALAGSIWASAHGLASLWAQGALSVAVPGSSLDDILTITLELALGQQGDTTP